jgi:hypothetical protein
VLQPRSRWRRAGVGTPGGCGAPLDSGGRHHARRGVGSGRTGARDTWIGDTRTRMRTSCWPGTAICSAPDGAGWAREPDGRQGVRSIRHGRPDGASVPALPVNHHWSQILERAIVADGGGVGPVALEGALFNGDEPEEPSQWPNLDRFGDSWSVRGFVWPVTGAGTAGLVRGSSRRRSIGRGGTARAEGECSLRAGSARSARCEPMRWPNGRGPRRQRDVRLRERTGGAPRRASDGTGSRTGFERTERPEEERLFDDPFRSTATAFGRQHRRGDALDAAHGQLHSAVRRAADEVIAVSPFVEVTLGGIAKVGGRAVRTGVVLWFHRCGHDFGGVYEWISAARCTVWDGME